MAVLGNTYFICWNKLTTTSAVNIRKAGKLDASTERVQAQDRHRARICMRSYNNPIAPYNFPTKAKAQKTSKQNCNAGPKQLKEGFGGYLSILYTSSMSHSGIVLCTVCSDPQAPDPKPPIPEPQQHRTLKETLYKPYRTLLIEILAEPSD